MRHAATLVLWIAATSLALDSARSAAASDALPVAQTEAGALFAGLQPNFSFPRLEADPQSELVGIVVDGRELETAIVYRVVDHFYLPLDLLNRMDIHGNARGGRLFLSTPGGEVETASGYFREIGGRTFFRADMLDQVLKIRWEFLEDRYAFSMTLPWWQRHGGQSSVLDPGRPTVDFSPSSFGLTQIRLDHTQFADRNFSRSRSDLLLRGRLANGVWRGEVIAEEGREARARDYYWLRDFEHVQALVGSQEVLINPLLPAVETTGAQALYSTEALDFNPYQDQTRSQYVRHFGIPARDIEGISQPGAIAELRVDQRPIARARVKLDGTYRFDSVRAPALQFQTVRVHILDQRSFVELDVQDFTRTPMDLLLNAKQMVAFGGAGMHGNPLDPARPRGGEALFGLVRYGLTDRVTVEGGVQSRQGVMHQVLGLSASMSRRWATTLSAGHHQGTYGVSMDLYGRGDRWQFTGRTQDFGAGFRRELGPASRFSELRYEFSMSPRLSVGMHGRTEDTANRRNDYLLPGMTWRFNRLNVLRVWPDFNGEYRLDLRTSHRERDWFEYVHDSTGDRAEYRYYRGPQLEFFGRLSHFREADRTTAELGTIWYPNEFDDRSLFAASVLGGDGGFGYRLTWRTTVLPGLFSHLELWDEPVATEFAQPGLQIRWTLSVDLAISGGRPIPARNDFLQARAGSIAGRLLLENGESLRSEGVDLIDILIDGRPHTAVLRGKHFFVGNIRPGVYDVSLDAQHLPMSLSPERATFRVRVVPAATTSVDFVVRREFGVAGRVLNAAGQPLAGVAVEATDARGARIKTTVTDPYGYYRFSGLPRGDYRLKIAGSDEPTAEREVAIVDRFVFDTDLTLRSP